MPTKRSVYFGADHAGFKLKEALRAAIDPKRHVAQDLSPRFEKGDDYPLSARKVAQAVLADKDALGILVCGTGHGMDIAANRMKGIRALVARTVKDAKLSREHNHANILVLGGWITKPADAKKIMQTFLKTKPSKVERHVRRVNELDL